MIQRDYACSEHGQYNKSCGRILTVLFGNYTSRNTNQISLALMTIPTITHHAYL
jgi:hypothetical protein